MVSWLTVIVTISLSVMIYFLVRGIVLALSSRDVPDAPEGDYEIKVIGKIKGGYLAIMRGVKSTDES